MTIVSLFWLVTIASIVGTVANIYHKRWCFWVWACTNALWTAYDLWLGAYPQAALMAVYFGLAIVGLWKWKRARQASLTEDAK